MEQITILGIRKQNGTITYQYEASVELKKYFSDREFTIEYPESIEAVPDGVAAIPFVCNVLPIVWLTNSKLVIPELDEAFYQCIPKVKKGYETMYPESEFLGEIEVGKIVPCDRPALPGKCAMFYSGGVDSMDTLFRHLKEQPTLISIWGSDIKYDNVDGWNLLHKAIEEAAERYQLPEVVIHSTFREFDREGELHKAFSGQLKDGWWHGVKHGIALLGHVAPYAYLHGLERMYIASTHCPEDGRVRCASNPLIDNNVRYVNCSVVHDGFQCSRQDKVHNIVCHARDNGDYLPLHVCWETQTGENCCNCEKCFRTIVGILVENEDPARLGFPGFERNLENIRTVLNVKYSEALRSYWTKIQDSLIANRRTIRNTPYWKTVRWIEKADFEHPETIQVPISIRAGVRPWLSQFRFYQALHEMKEKLKTR